MDIGNLTRKIFRKRESAQEAEADTTPSKPYNPDSLSGKAAIAVATIGTMLGAAKTAIANRYLSYLPTTLSQVDIPTMSANPAGLTQLSATLDHAGYREPESGVQLDINPDEPVEVDGQFSWGTPYGFVRVQSQNGGADNLVRAGVGFHVPSTVRDDKLGSAKYRVRSNLSPHVTFGNGPKGKNHRGIDGIGVTLTEEWEGVSDYDNRGRRKAALDRVERLSASYDSTDDLPLHFGLDLVAQSSPTTYGLLALSFDAGNLGEGDSEYLGAGFKVSIGVGKQVSPNITAELRGSVSKRDSYEAGQRIERSGPGFEFRVQHRR